MEKSKEIVFNGENGQFTVTIIRTLEDNYAYCVVDNITQNGNFQITFSIVIKIFRNNN